MARCDRCGKEEGMPYQCRLCGGTYCGEHRLPENHDCPGLDNWGDPGGVFDSGFDDSVNQSGEDRSVTDSVADALSIDTGAGSLFGYFRGNVTYLILALMWATFVAQLVVLGAGLGRLHDALFVLSSAHPEYVWTWVTSVFAHGGFGHIAVNSIALYFFGPIVERRVGSKKYALLFLGAGALAGLAQIGTALLLGEPTAANPTGVLGASGGIMAIMGVLTVLNPNLRVYLWFIIPMPLWILTIGFAFFSVTAVATGGGILGANVAHFAHLTGLVIGLAYGERLKREGTSAPRELSFGGGPGGPSGPGGPGRGRF